MTNSFQSKPHLASDAKKALADAVEALQPLPAVIRYYDDYHDKIRSIADPAKTTRWPVRKFGKSASINFDRFDPSIRPIVKNWVMWMFLNGDPNTSIGYFLALHAIASEAKEILSNFIGDPIRVKNYWETSIISMNLKLGQTIALKSLLNFFCDQGIGPWSMDYALFVAGLPYGEKRDKYRSVRDGEVFLTTQEEGLIVEYFDGLNEIVKADKEFVQDGKLRDACLLYWSYQHGLRPLQLSMINLNDVRQHVWNDGPPSIHVKIEYAKQRNNRTKYNPIQTRTMKRDWAWMLSAWLERRKNRANTLDLDRPDSLFGIPNVEITRAICNLTEKITRRRRTPTELRHTAAQRQVDAGCSSLELAEFLMHSRVTTGLVYFDFSPTQADRINRALGLSPVYSALSEIIKTRKVDKAKLLGLPDDQQIGAAPHGRPIIGIGGCGIGQSHCRKNPGLSCYTCQKFMPLDEREVHEEARDAVADTVREFIAAAKYDKGNPAFMQLRRTLEGIEQVLDDIGAEAAK